MKEVLAEDLTAMTHSVEQFQNTIQGMPIPTEPRPLSETRMKFRCIHLREEIDEYEKAWTEGNLPQQVDGLVDLIYVAMGAILEMGVMPRVPFEKVHEKNMLKVRGETKRPGSMGFDAVKPEGWTPPDIEAVLEDLRIRYKVSPQLIEVTKLSLAKNEDYNSETKREDYFPFGDVSYCQFIWTKASRAKNLVQRAIKGKPVFFEGIRDTLRDIINYATYWLEWLDKNEGLWAKDRRQSS